MKLVRYFLLLLFLTPSTAHASDPIGLWIKQAKVPIAYRPKVIHSGCDYPGLEHASCTAWGTGTVWLKWRDRWTFYHEMGHVLDFGMEQRWRSMFAVRLNDHRAWDESSGEDDPPLDEWWADLYASCATYGMNPPRESDRARVWLQGYGGWSPLISNYRFLCRKIKYHVYFLSEEAYRPVMDGQIPFPLPAG